MATLRDLKDIIRRDAQAENRYGRFLDLLAKTDERGTDPNWDLWYFSQNTDFCIFAARQARDEISELGSQLKTKQQNIDADVSFTFHDLRRAFAVFCMFAHASLESFAHEINIFYELEIPRKDVAIRTIATSLPSGTTLQKHLQRFLIEQDTRMLVEYRNAVVHGYVFPISGASSGLFLTATPRGGFFDFDSNDVELISLTDRVVDKTKVFIADGWKCFSRDELSPMP